MGIPFIIGASQQKKKQIFGFEPYIAPDNFDITSQSVDIYDKFDRYYRINPNARYIYKVLDSFNHSQLGGTDRLKLLPFHAYDQNSTWGFIYGYTRDGIDYTSSEVKIATSSSVTSTTITVNSTASFPDNGILCTEGISYLGNGYFVYTSKDDTHFYGTNYGATQQWGGAVSLVVDFSGTTKRWVIVTNTRSFTDPTFACYFTSPGIEWGYSAKCAAVFTGSGPNHVSNTIKYIHCSSLNDITNPIVAYSTGVRGTGLIGTLHIPTGLSTIPDSFYSGAVGVTGSLIIPSNIQIIGEGAFTNISFTNIISYSSNFNVTDYVLYDVTGGTKVEANYAAKGVAGALVFRNDTTKILGYCCYNCTTKTGTLTIPTTCTSIGNFSFYYCTGLTGNLIIPNSITSLGTCAYYYCSGLTGDLIIPNSLTTIYEQTFQQCSGLNGTLTFEPVSQIVTIGNYAFSYTKLTGSLTFPASLRNLSYTAFYYCSYINGSLTFEEGIQTFTCQTFMNGCAFTGTLTIPSTVTSITYPYFFTQSNFSTFVLSPGNTSYIVVDNILYDIRNSKKIAVACARNYSGTLTLESDTTEIGINAFNNCTKRTGALDIPNSVTKINSGSFYNCTGLNGALTIGTGLVNAIAAETFYLTNFSSITSSSSVIIAYDNVLYDEVTGGSIKAVICARGYSGTLTLKTGITEILTSAFYYCSNRTGSLTIPSTLTVKIPARAFGNCTGFNGALNFDCPTLTAHDQATYTSFYNCPNFNALNICAGYSSTWLTHNFCNNFSGASLDASSANITSGTKTWTIGPTNKARMSAGAIAAALARGITIA